MSAHRILAGVLLILPMAVYGTPRDPVEWIRTAAIPLSTPEAGHGFTDLQPLKAMVGDARIVSLGEPTHGSREVFQLKHRMLEFLATEMGFTVFAIEASMPEAYRMNEYVRTGEGDPARLIKQLGFWTWDTEEVLAMVLWMREFNRSGRGQLQFTGFDMQNPAMAVANVTTFVDAHDKGFLPTLGEAKVRMPGYFADRWTGVLAHLEAQAPSYRARGASPAAIDWAIQNARIVLQGLPDTLAVRTRDQSMADNVRWIADQNPGARMVLWAHNAHIAATALGSGMKEPMGHHLRATFGSQMLVTGILFGGGEFQAIARPSGKLKAISVPSAPTDSLDGVFLESGLPLFAVDLRTAPAWFDVARTSRFIGSSYPDDQTFANMVPIVATDIFDAVLFVRSTTSARPLPR